MGKVFDSIDPELGAFLEAQPLFFVATAPLAADGHVNLSPKGLDGTFAVLDPTTVAYLDLTGSGIETVAHVRENGRVTLLFCAFEGRPRIVRIHGRGEILPAGSERFAALAPRFSAFASARSIVTVRATRISDSCGYGVPRMQLVAQRTQLVDWAERNGPDAVVAYQRERNAVSLDGLPGIDPGEDEAPS